MRGSLTLRVASCVLLLGALASCLALSVVRITFTGDYPPLVLILGAAGGTAAGLLARRPVTAGLALRLNVPPGRWMPGQGRRAVGL
jgi:hypothetical protein